MKEESKMVFLFKSSNVLFFTFRFIMAHRRHRYEASYISLPIVYIITIFRLQRKTKAKL